nr:ribonuclease H-like domain, reverse transcriptase, RNA-dependent DNA polymerase [Tanacetum cinerariifolium]
MAAKTVMSNFARERKEDFKPNKPSVMLKYPESIHFSTTCMIKGTDHTNWDDIWYISNQTDKHLCYKLDSFCNIKEGFSVNKLEKQMKFLFTYGVFEVLIKDDGQGYLVPGVYYVPEVTLNILSIDLLENMDEDLIQIKGNLYSTKVNNFKEYAAFLNLIKQDDVVSQEWDIFRKKFNKVELLLAEDDLKNYKEASSDKKWIEAMKVELDSIDRNNTWELATLPKGHKAIGLKWVFNTKKDANGNIIKHKARLVAKGYISGNGIDFKEVFAPIARMETIRLLLAIAANNKWEVHHLDVKSAFLHGDLKRRSQYAYANKILKKAGMLDCNETLLPMDPGTRLTKVTEGTMVNSTEYRSIIGCLRYLLHTRPDLSYSVGLLNRFMQEPREQHMKAIRQVLLYVKGTKDHRITYKHNERNKIHGYNDSSYGVNTQERKGNTATAITTQALWLKRLLSKLTHSEEDKVTIRVDNKSAIALIKNLVFHGRSKHIDTKYHFIRECVEREDIQVEFHMRPLSPSSQFTKAMVNAVNKVEETL